MVIPRNGSYSFSDFIMHQYHVCEGVMSVCSPNFIILFRGSDSASCVAPNGDNKAAIQVLCNAGGWGVYCAKS